MLLLDTDACGGTFSRSCSILTSFGSGGLIKFLRSENGFLPIGAVPDVGFSLFGIVSTAKGFTTSLVLGRLRAGILMVLNGSDVMTVSSWILWLGFLFSDGREIS